jgi:hypothetical protein
MINSARSWRIAVSLLLLWGGVTAGAAQAQPRTWFASLNYESSHLLVPVIVVVSADDDGREWSVGLTGWTLSADWKAAAGDRHKRHMFARLTPVNANSSNFIYRDGVRDAAAEFRASAVEGGVGIEVTQTRRWTGGYRGLVLYHRVGGISDHDVSTFWRRPFGGVEVTQQYTRVTSEERFGSRWTGVKIVAAGRMMGGSRTWTRAHVTAGAGKRTGRLFLSGGGAAFTGHSLNMANAFVLGGSWDVPSAEMVPGYHYAEFRPNRAATVGGALDIGLHRSWEIGVRAGALRGPSIDVQGAALQAGTVWRGAVFNGGVAFPVGMWSERKRRGTVAFATVTAALMDR